MSDVRLTKGHRRARPKRRVVNQVQGERGEEAVRDALPGIWAVRKINPDYGLDLHAEVFQPIDDLGNAETRGEHLYIQCKSVERTNVVESEVAVGRQRDGLGKGLLHILKCKVDTDELATIEAMGAAVPVLLCLNTRDTNKVYLVCLNDYIEKEFRDRGVDYEAKESKTLHIPVVNCLSDSEDVLTYLHVLARRPKLYHAFNLFSAQFRTVDAALGHTNVDDLFPEARGDVSTTVKLDPAIVEEVSEFCQRNLRLDIWDGRGAWPALNGTHDAFRQLPQELAAAAAGVNYEDGVGVVMKAHMTFYAAATLSALYEEFGRAARLPSTVAIDEHLRRLK